MNRKAKRTRRMTQTDGRRLLGMFALTLITAGYFLRGSMAMPPDVLSESPTATPSSAPAYSRAVLRADAPAPAIPADTPSQSPTPPAPSASPSPVDSDPAVRTITVTPSDALEHADGVFLKNETSYEIDVRSYLESELPEEVRTAPQHIIIVHTHASEAYYPAGESEYIPTDVQRTEDEHYNMIRVGDAMAERLAAAGLQVTHLREVFDYPSYTGSYTRTLAALSEALEADPETCIILDLHRDAINASDGSTYRLVTDTVQGRAAQMMLVVGTDEGGLAHPDWRRNRCFAIHLQKQINDSVPGLMRPVALSVSRYNQHLTPGSLIVEIGAAGNLLEEALLSAELFSDAFCHFLTEISG